MLDLDIKRSVVALYYVAFELALQGLVPLPTVKNGKGFDIAIINPTNGKCANLQVRTQSRNGRWSAKTSNIQNLVYIFVQFTEEDKPGSFYIIPEAEVERIGEREEKGVEYYFYKGKVAPYEKKWEVIQELLR